MDVSLRDRGFFESRDGTKLYYQSVVPQAPESYVALLHGYGDHGGRYVGTAKWLAEQRIATYLFDYRGHGQASGVRGHCLSFQEFHEDMTAILGVASARAEGRPLFLLGHSHGGLLVLSYLSQRAVERVAGAIVTAPFLGLALKVPRAKRALAEVMSKVWPTLALPTGVRGAFLSHDPEVARGYDEDRLVNKNATARWFTEALAAQAAVFEAAKRVTTPLFIGQGTGDRVVDVEATRRFSELVGSQEKTCKFYEGAYHEILFERSDIKDRVLQDIVEFMRRRLSVAQAAGQ